MCVRVVTVCVIVLKENQTSLWRSEPNIPCAPPSDAVAGFPRFPFLAFPSLFASHLPPNPTPPAPNQTKSNPPPPPPFPPAAATSRWPEAAAQAQARRRAGRVPAAAGAEAVGRATGTAAAAATATTPSARSATAASSRASSSTPTPRATPSGCPAPGTGSAPVTPLSQRPAYFFFFCLLCFCPGLRCGFRFRVSQLPPSSISTWNVK